ncbi:hypothetical protein [Haloarcula sp. K1]|jgi:hypothetical protein|uniref:hypothetical protein n=1 Tax=Haloarcula sp. K1 TaxID=1622207 RepID=UPI0007BC348C|nr:hypothetical protein [Haloarcula sp. K1]KZX46299.1 hypothetical protein AV929_16140 [Haloarcula sp. K1]
MTYEIPENPRREAEVETAHDKLATEHGRDNVLVTEVDGNIISIVGDNVGTIDPVTVNVDDLK